MRFGHGPNRTKKNIAFGQMYIFGQKFFFRPKNLVSNLFDWASDRNVFLYVSANWQCSLSLLYLQQLMPLFARLFEKGGPFSISLRMMIYTHNHSKITLKIKNFLCFRTQQPMSHKRFKKKEIASSTIENQISSVIRKK